MTSTSCSACGKVGIRMDNKGRWLDPELCAGARQEEVEYTRRRKMYTRVSRDVCLRETGRAPIKTGWAETDKGQPGKPNVRARWVAKEYKTHAKPELCASTPPLEALKVVLSEIATGKRGGKVWPWWTCEGRISTLQHEERCLSNCHPRTTSQVTNTFAGCCDTVCTALATLHRIGMKLTRGNACPCVWRGHIKVGGHYRNYTW